MHQPAPALGLTADVTVDKQSIIAERVLGSGSSPHRACEGQGGTVGRMTRGQNLCVGPWVAAEGAVGWLSEPALPAPTSL